MVNAVSRVDTINRADCRSRCEQMFSQTAVVDGYVDLYNTRIEAMHAA
jgi:hypothetical protein